jgi:hypothetical protein
MRPSPRTAVLNTRGPRGGRVALRATTAIAVCAWLIGQGSTLAHLALVRHSLCAEHGDFVDANGPEHAAAHPHRAGFEPCTAVAADDAQTVEREDAHCSVVGSRPDRSALALIAARTIDPACAAPIADAPRKTPRVYANARYRLAPKTSPPA